MSVKTYKRIAYEAAMSTIDVANGMINRLTSERDAARARITELIETRALAGVLDDVSLVDWLQEELNSAADCRERLKELESMNIVTPRKCRPECWLKGWQAAIKAAAIVCDERNIGNIMYPWTDPGYGEMIRALMPTDDCGGECNPLEPPDDAVSVIDDEKVFGKSAWVYCNQHRKPHQTGWCSVSVHDKVGLGIIGDTRDDAVNAASKCREWKLSLYGED